MLNMNVVEFEKIISEKSEIENEMYQLMKELYPICRSITGNGVRKTLSILRRYIPLQIHEVPSGTTVFDWTIPKEWNINDAFIKDSTGKKIVDFKKCNLHVMNYSVPVHKKISLEELKKHVYTIPEQPNDIPYLTTYYDEKWGFCMTHNDFVKLSDGQYEVFIDSSLKNGSLTYGEFYIKGERSDEILLTCYVCHPSLCNDNLSGMVLITMLARYLNSLTNRYSFRFLFIPETIGSITWLSINEKKIPEIKHGLVATCVGDSGPFTYKKTRMGNTELDRVVNFVLKNSDKKFKIIDFVPYGSDERQFCSTAFNMPVGSLVRSLYPLPKEYHTSADNFEFVKKENLSESFAIYLYILMILEQNQIYKNMNPKCEPQLSKRGLYSKLGSTKYKLKKDMHEIVFLWILNLSDGRHTLLDIAEKSGIDFILLKKSVDILQKNNLLKISELKNYS